MENNFDVNEQLREKNQEMLLEKKKTDLDKSTDTLIEFYRFYSLETIVNEIKDRVCVFNNVDGQSEQAEIFKRTIVAFLSVACDEFEKELKNKRELLKIKITKLSDEAYNKELQYLSVSVTNYLSEYYIKNLEMLNMELNQSTNEENKERIMKYLTDVITVKMINNLREKFIYSMKVISNNNEENKEIIESINEKTIKGV